MIHIEVLRLLLLTSYDLAADEIMTTFEVGFDFVPLLILQEQAVAQPWWWHNGTVGDTFLAIQEITSDRDASRLTRDTEGRQPGDSGYTHGMIFAHAGKLHRIVDVQNDSSVSYIEFEDVPNSRIRAGTQTGLEAVLNYEKNVECGLSTVKRVRLLLLFFY